MSHSGYVQQKLQGVVVEENHQHEDVHERSSLLQHRQMGYTRLRELPEDSRLIAP